MIGSETENLSAIDKSVSALTSGSVVDNQAIPALIVLCGIIGAGVEQDKPVMLRLLRAAIEQRHPTITDILKNSEQFSWG